MSTVDEGPKVVDRRQRPDGGDLDYYAKPENYQGTKDSMLRFLTTHRPGRDKSPAVDEPTGSAAPDRKGVDTPRKTQPVTGVWTHNRGTLDRVTATSRPPAAFVRRITVNPGEDGSQRDDGGGFGDGAKRDGRYSIAVTGLREEEPCGAADAPTDSSRSSVAGGGSDRGLTPQSKEIARQKVSVHRLL